MKKVPGTLFSNLVNEILTEGLVASRNTEKLNQKIVDEIGPKIKEVVSTNLVDVLHKTKYGKIFTTEFIVLNLNNEDKKIYRKFV